MNLTHGLRRAATLQPDKPALVFGARTTAWRDFADRVARCAAGLRAIGLETGDRVAMLAQNSDRYLEYYFAVLWAGGVLVPLNTRLAPPELVDILQDSGTRILLADDEFWSVAAALKAQSNGLTTLVYAGDADQAPGEADHCYETLIHDHAPADDALRGGDDLAAIVYTGGTTGRPKGVMLSHGGLFFSALGHQANLRFNADMVYLHTAPLFHLGGGARVFSAALATAKNIVLPKFAPEAVLTAIETHRVSHLLLMPTMINMLINFERFDDFDISSLTDIAYGGSAMPEALLRSAMAKMPDVGFTQSYGQTELSPSGAFLEPKYHALDGPYAGKLTSCGRAIFGADVRIVDGEDNERPRGEIGEIAVRGPMVMLGYWKMPEETAEALRNGWLHTGDAGYMDEDGFIFLVDRIKDIIISGGENVYSAEVENAIYRYLAVKECAVVGIPDEKWSEAVHAIVVPKDGETITADAIIAHCRELIAGYKCPRSVTVRSEPLPLSSVNKIHKAALRAPYWEGRERRIN